LIELLVTILILGMLAAIVLTAFSRARETARAQKTRALVAKLDALIKGKWEAYKTRRVPVKIPPGAEPRDAARMRLDALHDLMRMELPDRWTDVVDNPVAPFRDPPYMDPTIINRIGPPIARPAVSQGYLRRYNAIVGGMSGALPAAIAENQGAECLYLIVTSSVADESDGRDLFKAANVADTDNDGFPEFVDGWGRPIKFLRWPAGFLSDLVILARGTVTFVPTPTFTWPAIREYFVEFDRLAVTSGKFPNSGFSERDGAYTGATLAMANSYGSHVLLYSLGSIAKISGYTYSGTTARFRCAVPPTSGQGPFGDREPSPGDEYVVLAPDPFDPQGVYPQYPPGPTWPPGGPDWSLRTWAVYPLIYSAGPDGQYDIVEDIPPDVLHYTQVGLSPFFIDKIPAPSFDPMGMPSDPASRAPFWQDNIHNHLLATR